MNDVSQGIKELDGKAIPQIVQNKIAELLSLETTLGHLPPQEYALKDLHRRVNDPGFPFHANQMEQKTELLFSDICDDLVSLGFSHAQIADIINSYLKYPGGPRYCDSSEVRAALES